MTLLVIMMMFQANTGGGGVDAMYMLGPKWFKLVREEIKRVFTGKSNEKETLKIVDDISKSLPRRFHGPSQHGVEKVKEERVMK